MLLKIKEFFCQKYDSFDKVSRSLIIACGAVFIFSFICWLPTVKGIRYSLRFQSVDSGKLCVESRVLPHEKWPGMVRLYVDELLLGPKMERSRPLFAPGTRETMCFVRDGILYVNLTQDALLRTGSASEIKAGADLFKKNILDTFGRIKAVRLYIDNKAAYEEL